MGVGFRGGEGDRGRDRRSDAVLAGDVLALVNVTFGERDFVWDGVFVGEGLEGRGDGFAGAAPGCMDCGKVSAFGSTLLPCFILLRG